MQSAVVEHNRIAVIGNGDPSHGCGSRFGSARSRAYRPRLTGLAGIWGDYGVGYGCVIGFHGCDRAPGFKGDLVQPSDVTRVFLACLTVHPCDGGTGQNVVELGEQQGLPDTVQFLTRIDVTWVLDTGHGAQVFDDTQH